MESVFVSSHDGKYIKAGNGREAGVRNSYEIWKNTDDSLYIKMKVMKEGVNIQTLFDYTDLENVLKSGIWYVMGAGYVATSVNFRYLHHLIMDFVGTGKGFQKVSIDHINRDPLDNRKQNLRLATCEEQKQNSKGQLEGTKRNRKKDAVQLPEGISQSDIPKYVVYYTEKYGPADKKVVRDFFRIEKHPGQMLDEPLLKNKWATSKSMKNFTIREKLDSAISELRKLEELYAKIKNN